MRGGGTKYKIAQWLSSALPNYRNVILGNQHTYIICHTIVLIALGN